MPYATPTQVAVLIPKAELSAAEQAMIGERIAQVERKILRRIPDLADRITSGAITVDDVRDVVVASVLRVVRNPDGYIQESDGTYTYMLSSEMVQTELTITDEEWEALGELPGADGIGWIAPVIRAPA